MRTLRLITVVGVLIFACKSVSAQFVFGAHVIKVVDLPNTSEYSVSTDQPFSSPRYCDLGITHKQFSCVFPLWNYGEPKYVLYREKAPGEFSEADYFTYNLTDEEIAYFHEMYGIPIIPEIPFWHKWGGKICFIIVTILMIWIIDNIF